MTPKQALMAHMMNQHAFSRPAGTYKVMTANHKGHHDRNPYLTHRHRIAGWDTEGNQILDVDDQIEIKIALCPPKNPNASRNGDRNWVVNIAHKGGGYRYELPGTWEGDIRGAKDAADKLLGFQANWVINATGYGYQHQEETTT